MSSRACGSKERARSAWEIRDIYGQHGRGGEGRGSSRSSCLGAVNVAVGQHEGGVLGVHELLGYVADELRILLLRQGQRRRQSAEALLRQRVLSGALLFVAKPLLRQEENVPPRGATDARKMEIRPSNQNQRGRQRRRRIKNLQTKDTVSSAPSSLLEDRCSATAPVSSHRVCKTPA